MRHLFVCSLEYEKSELMYFEYLATLLLRSLWSVFRVLNHIRLSVFGNLYLSDPARRSVLLARCWIVVAVVDRL